MERREDPVPKVGDFQITSRWVPMTPAKPQHQQIYTSSQLNQLFGSNFPVREKVYVNETEIRQENWSESHRSQSEFQRQTEPQDACWDTTPNVTRNFDIWDAVSQEKPLQPELSVDPLDQWSNLRFGELMALAATATATANIPEPSAYNSVEFNRFGESSSGVTTMNNSMELNRFGPSSGTTMNFMEVNRFESSSVTAQGLHPSVGGINSWFNTFVRQDMAQCESSTRTQLTFDLNSPQREFIQPIAPTFGPRFAPRFAPVTPNQSKRAENKQVSDDVQKRSTDERNEVVATSSRVVEAGELHEIENEQLLENHNPDNKGGMQEIDLNKTQQPKPRRRKHRPKVVREGQSKRTPKPATPKPPTGPSETPTGKRKYVRKKVLDKPPTTPSVAPVDPKTVGNGAKSCRISLNFDFEGQEHIPPSNLNSESQAQNFTKLQEKSSVQQGQGIEDETTQLGVAHDVTDYVSIAERENPGLSAPIRAHGKSKADNAVTVTECTRGKCRINFSNETHDKHESISGVAPPRSPNDSNCSTSTSASLARREEERVQKRAFSSTMDETQLREVKVIGTNQNGTPMYEMAPMHFSEIYKKQRNEKWQVSSRSSMPTVTAEGNCMRKATSYPLNNDACFEPVIAQQFDYSLTANKTAAENSARYNQQNLQYMLPSHPGERLTKKRSRAPTRVRDVSSLMRIVENNQKPVFSAPAQQQQHTSMAALVAKTCPPVATKKRTRRKALLGSMPESFTKPRGPSEDIIGRNSWSLDAIVERLKQLDINGVANQVVAYYEQNALVPYYGRYQEKNALVLYRKDGTMVPFDGSFDPSKKKKPPRAKVDLDEETDKVWRLLLENINNEGIDGSNEEKAKWWEEERKVFRGRADSFIARMHLVQGDRRFSRWKGSVVDSVVGVFLTQNVSDHLSSSAYMSLAARFPLQSESNHGSCSKDGNGILIEEPEPDVCILDPEDTIKWHDEKSSQPIYDPSSVILHDEAYNVATLNGNGTFGSSSSCINNGVQSTNNSKCELLENILSNKSTAQRQELDDLLSSQNFVVSPQNSITSPAVVFMDGIGSGSQGDSNDLTYISSTTKSFDNPPSYMELLKMQEQIMMNGIYNVQNQANSIRCPSEEQNKQYVPCGNCPSQLATNNAGARSIECIDLLEEESGFSNTASEIEDKCPSEQSGITESIKGATFQEAATASPREVNELLQSQSLPANNPQVLKVQNFSAETSDTRSRENSGHDVDGSNMKARGKLPMDTLDRKKVKTSRATKGKSRTEKPVDWDNLRKQAQPNGVKRERTANTLDSMDWEAIRCADVNVIADTIKERGMNNMLAERIKDFLNRLVRDHGSIDLEWLRDVPPDKAKEYLLSIRGLGLKSVECVRLLTLHHLAFPVDTNVGRIAVRLGWVPLQPLPESLQLHLLELYPVLESIQKYLWPRLCKLDQRTLYELHYQMITFGKVFCTKSKPNCNACPMRGECRHFASAFASARLSLPGPEEKRIVCAVDGKEGIQNPTEVFNPLQLPPPQINYQAGAVCEVKSNQPIIEVPASPEPIVEEPTTPEEVHTKILECDIEDALFGEDEDDDYIPTIELNVKEFAQNLQNYMQNNMELQEADMSKALVALTPDAAAIPTPKLKNMSRLRTEHQVYELPDSHPLLEGMDKREPDDPCSYLLAIWTPGETANSIQPPEISCNSQEYGQLCDETTCFSCNSVREANNQTVRGTILIPCRTAMRGSFPLNGTYFQVNEVFADHDSSITPIDVPRSWIWNLPRRTVYFGTSIPTIFKGLTTEGIQYCFWKGFVCVRGFDQKTRAPRPLMARLHFPASKLVRTKGKTETEDK